MIHRLGSTAMAVGPWLGLLVLGLVAACEGPDPTPQEACEEAGGSWYEDGCSGDADRCGAVICEVGVDAGCHCDQPGQCYDGETCVGSPPPPGDAGSGGGFP